MRAQRGVGSGHVADGADGADGACRATGAILRQARKSILERRHPAGIRFLLLGAPMQRLAARGKR